MCLNLIQDETKAETLNTPTQTHDSTWLSKPKTPVPIAASQLKK